MIISKSNIINLKNPYSINNAERKNNKTLKLKLIDYKIM
jgi:hypothetical protein